MGIADWNSPEWKAAWPQLVEDVPRIIEAHGVPITGPTDDPDFDVTPPLADVKKGIWINGVGDESHDDFVISRENPYPTCKTNEREYDPVVTCILLRAKMLAPTAFSVSSDGNWDDDWEPARCIYQRIWPGDEIKSPLSDHDVLSDDEEESGASSKTKITH